MPRINRIRIVNVAYDHGQKQFVDNIFRLNSRHGLLNLANGGGKTLLLQLLLQTVLPNVELNSRKFEEIFEGEKRTSHILIEWLLDDLSTLLLTGICATKGQEDESIRYFLYTHSYNKSNNMDIEQIPILHSDKRTAGYEEFWGTLKKEKTKKPIQTFTQNERSTYIRHLESYQIYQREWNGILKTNQSEGGIEGYFSNNMSAYKVVSNLIMPIVEEGIFSSEQDAMQLTQAFKKHRDNLVKIPYLRKQIEDFETFKKLSMEFLEALLKYNQIKEQQSKRGTKLHYLKNHIQSVTKGLYDEKSTLEKQSEDIGKELALYRYEQESLEVYVLQQKLDELVRKLEELRGQEAQSADKLRGLKHRIDVYKCINLHLDMKEKQAELDTYLIQKADMLKGKADIQKEYNRWHFSLKSAIKGRLEEIQDGIESFQKESADIADKLKELEKSLKEQGQRKEDVGKEKGKLEGESRLLERVEGELRQIFPDRLYLDGEALLQEVESQIAGNVEAMGKKQSEQGALKKAVKGLEDILKGLDEQKRESESQKASIEAYFSAYEADRQKALSTAMCYESDDCHSSTAIHRIQARLIEFRDKQINNEIELNKLGAESLLLQDKDYYISDSEYIRLLDLLEDHGFQPMLGARYIKKLATSEERRQAVVSNPLLPYGIIISHKDFSKGEKIKAVLEKETFRIPIFLLEREQMHTVFAKEDVGFKVPLHEGYTLYLEDEAFQNKKVGIEVRIKELEAENRLIARELEEMNGHKASLEDFQRRYPKERVEEREKAFEQVQGKILGLASDIEETVAKIKKAEAETLSLREEIHELTIENIGLEGKKNLIGKYQQELLEDEKRKRQIEALETELMSLERTARELDETKKGLEANRDIIKERMKALQIRQKEENTFKETYLTEDIEAEVLIEDIPYDGLRSGFLAKYELLKQGIEGLSGLDKTIQLLEEGIRDKEKQIGELEVDREYYINEAYRVSEERIFDVIAMHKEADVALEKLKKEITSMEIAEGVEKGNIQHMSDLIYKNHGKHPHIEIGERTPEAYRPILKSKLRDVKFREEKIKKSKDEIDNKIKSIEETLQDITLFIEIKTITEEKSLIPQDELRDLYALDAKVLLKQLKSDFTEAESSLLRQRKTALSKRSRLKSDLSELANDTINKFLKTMPNELNESEEEKMLNYTNVKSFFDQCFHLIDNNKEIVQTSLREYEKDKEQLVERCALQAKRIYDEIQMIDGYSKITMNGRKDKMVQIEMEAIEDRSNIEKVKNYIDANINKLSRMERENGSDIEKEINMIMKPVQLLNAISNLKNAQIKILKPEQLGTKPLYIPWESLKKWSGGEQYTGFFSMFICLISYLRSKMDSSKDSGKVLIADNPFGKASSKHLLDILFELARKNHIQMICVTAHKDENIYQKFDVVYSLALRNAGKRAVMTSKSEKGQVEAGFYILDAEGVGVGDAAV